MGSDRPRLPSPMAMNAPLLVCPISSPSGQRDQRGDQQGGQGVADVLGEPLGDRGVSGRGASWRRRRGSRSSSASACGATTFMRWLPTRVHGVSRRWSSTSATSNSPASSIESTMPMMIGSAKPSWKPLVNRVPRPPAPTRAPDADQADVGDRRDPEAGEQHRRRHRQLDAEQLADRPEAQGAGGLRGLALHRDQGVRHRPGQQGQRVEGQADQHVDGGQDARPR